MSQQEAININDVNHIREMLHGSGYSDKAIAYYMDKTNMGVLDDADQVSELAGPCGDTMKIYLKMDNGRIGDAKIQVLGCPGAVASAMAAMEMIKGKTFEEVRSMKDRDIFRLLEEIPNEKHFSVRIRLDSITN